MSCTLLELDSTTTTENFEEPSEQGSAVSDLINAALGSDLYHTAQHDQGMNSPLQQLDISERIVISDSDESASPISCLSHLFCHFKHQIMKINRSLWFVMTSPGDFSFQTTTNNIEHL